jgi:hypothetical protein
VSNFMKGVFAGLRQAGKAPSSTTPVRRTCPAVESLEERLALSSFPNLMGDVFLLHDPTGKTIGKMTIVQENRQTGAFKGLFFDLTANNHLGTVAAGAGQIGRPKHNRASITFDGGGQAGAPGVPFVPGEVQIVMLTGLVKGERHQAAITASLTAQDLFWAASTVVSAPQVANVQTQVTGHA